MRPTADLGTTPRSSQPAPHPRRMLRPLAIRTSEATETGLANRVIVPSSCRVDMHVLVEERWHFRVMASGVAGECQVAIFAADERGELVLDRPVAQSAKCTVAQALMEIEVNHARMVELADVWLKAAARAAVAAQRSETAES